VCSSTSNHVLVNSFLKLADNHLPNSSALNSNAIWKWRIESADINPQCIIGPLLLNTFNNFLLGIRPGSTSYKIMRPVASLNPENLSLRNQTHHREGYLLFLLDHAPVA
jgi:hypothetical protein